MGSLTRVSLDDKKTGRSGRGSHMDGWLWPPTNSLLFWGGGVGVLSLQPSEHVLGVDRRLSQQNDV